jgi:hypothetical protein
MPRTPTPYPDLNAMLHGLVANIQLALGEHFVGAYLQGSFAIGDFDRDSDVDFVIVTTVDLSTEEVHSLQLLHARTFAQGGSWARRLQGSYFPRDVLRHQPRSDSRCWKRGEPCGNALVWYLDAHQSLVRSDHCNTLVVRWILRERGVILAGPALLTLIDPIPGTALRQEMLTAIRGWGQDFLAHPGFYKSHFFQTFFVLNSCRMLHDLHAGVPGSKLAGVGWAKAHLESSWGGLIDRAWAARTKPESAPRQPADPDEFQATRDFVRYVIAESRAYATAHQLA